MTQDNTPPGLIFKAPLLALSTIIPKPNDTFPETCRSNLSNDALFRDRLSSCGGGAELLNRSRECVVLCVTYGHLRCTRSSFTPSIVFGDNANGTSVTRQRAESAGNNRTAVVAAGRPSFSEKQQHNSSSTTGRALTAGLALEGAKAGVLSWATTAKNLPNRDNLPEVVVLALLCLQQSCTTGRGLIDYLCVVPSDTGLR